MKQIFIFLNVWQRYPILVIFWWKIPFSIIFFGKVENGTIKKWNTFLYLVFWKSEDNDNNPILVIFPFSIKFIFVKMENGISEKRNFFLFHCYYPFDWYSCWLYWDEKYHFLTIFISRWKMEQVKNETRLFIKLKASQPLPLPAKNSFSLSLPFEKKLIKISPCLFLYWSPN